MAAGATPEIREHAGHESGSERSPGPAVAELPSGALLNRRQASVLRAQRSAGNRAVAQAIQAARVQRKPIDQLDAAPDSAQKPATPQQPTEWLGRQVDSDLPRNPDGSVADPRAAIGRGIPKINSRDVQTGDAVLKHGVGVGNMFTPIKRGVMKPVGKPGAGTSESVVMVDTTTGRKYLFKPIGGEPDVDYAEARGVGAGHFAERARASSLAADALGVATPDVRLVSISGRKGSLTEWVEPKAGGEVMSLATYAKQDEQRFKALQNTKPFQEALSGVQALDYLINNLDRVNNLGNYMIELDENKQFKALIPIDQELSFTRTTDRAIIHGRTSLMPTQWTKSLADKVAELHADPSAFIARIRPLVGDHAVAGVIARLGQLHADGIRRGFIAPRPGMPGAAGMAGGGGGPGHGATGQGRKPPPLAQGGETPPAEDVPLAHGGSTAGTAPPLAGGGKTAGTGPGTGTGPPQPTGAPRPTGTPRPPSGLPDTNDPGDITRPDIQLQQPGGAGAPALGSEELPTLAKSRTNSQLIQTDTGVDARARARAAEFAPLYFEWKELHPVERQEKIERIINAHLASQGVPPIYVNEDPNEKASRGSASFSFQQWRVEISRATLHNEQITKDQFAEVVDAASHEARHAVHHFRGLRIALSNGRYDPSHKVPPDIVDRAKEANQARHPKDEFSKEAYREASEIYELTHRQAIRRERIAARAKLEGRTLEATDIIDREEIIQRRKDLKAQFDADDNKVKALERDGKTGTLEYKTAVQDRNLALREADKAHDEYTAIAQETDAWRYGSAARKATVERLTIMERRNAAEAARVDAERAAQQAWKRDDAAFEAAKAAYVAAARRVGQADRELAALTPVAPREVGGRLMTQEIPADPNSAPRARRPLAQPADWDATGVDEARAAPGGQARAATPRPARGTPPPPPTPGGAPTAQPTAPTTAPKAAIKPDAAPLVPAEVDQPDEQVAPKWADDPRNLKREWAKTATTSGRTGDRKKTTAKAVSAGPDGPKAELRQRVEETAPDGSTKAREASGTAGANLQEGFTLDVKGKTEAPTGPGHEGPKPGSEVSARAYVNPNQIGGQVEAMKNTAGGGQHGMTGGGTYDWKTGDTTASAGYKGTTKGGHSASFALTSGNSVRAEEPEEISEGVWEVRFTWTDNDGASAGLSGRMPGGMELSIGGSETDSKTKTGSKRFPDEAKALEFKKNVRAEIEKEIAAAKFLPPLNTVAGALRIPEGETRGFGAANTKSGNVSGGFASGSLGKSGFKTTGYSVDILHVSGPTVRVTVLVTTGKGSAWTASGLGLTNESGGSESSAVGVTYEFNLAKKEEGAAYERYVVFPLPAPAGKMPYSTRRLSSEEEHDNYALLWGTAGFGGEVSEDITVDQQGEHARFTGAQTEDVNPGLIMGLFDDEKHARAEIVSSAENGKAVGFAAKMSVSGESGEFNRQQFGKIFMGATFSGTAQASGKWTLTAAIPKESVRQLQEVSSDFRNAKTTYEKLRIYSKLVKKNGAQMLGGQVGITSLAWNLELKGDSNFPGEKGRAKLNNERAQLLDRLAKKPDEAFTIAREAKETLDALDVRYRAVKDETKYTDLPDGLRKEQLEVIRGHMREFILVRQRALGVGSRHDPNESLADVEKRAYSEGGYNQIPGNERERVELQDGIRLANRDVIQRFNQTYNASLALKDVMPGWGAFRFAEDVDGPTMASATGSAMDDIKAAFDFNRRQLEVESQVKILWETWDREPDQAKKLAAMKPLLAKLRERLGVLDQQLDHLRKAGRTLYHHVPFYLKQKHPKFWISVSEARDEPLEETSMAL